MIGQKLQEIHDKDIVHNDLKLNNVTVTNKPKLEVHLIDYGLSTRAGEVFNIDRKLYWMAPEMPAGQPLVKF